MNNIAKMWQFAGKGLSEGLMMVGFESRKIIEVNPSAAALLGKPEEAFREKTLYECFGEDERNDELLQLIIDAVYDKENPHSAVVPYYIGEARKDLYVHTSFLTDDGVRIGIVVIFNDITELLELRDAIKAMERIQKLNTQLESRNQLLYVAFGRYMSDAVVKELLDNPDGLDIKGTKRCITIMMSDLRGFTARSEHMAPEALLDMLNHYLETMTKILRRYNGTIIELLGDGILAIFGAPGENEHHAADAVAAAIAMQNAMEEINEWNRERGYGDLEMGIGLNTGDAIIGNIGSEMRTKYAVTGRNVNLCGRIESYTTGGQILISPLTKELADCRLTIEEEIEVYPKGTTKPITVSSVTAIGVPYCLENRLKKEILPRVLPAPIPVKFRVIRNKHAAAEFSDGTFTAICDDGGIFVSDMEMERFENLEISVCGQLYAKLVEQDENGQKLIFTSKPEGFTDWLKTLF